ncbi:MAG: antibiotic biosynthesis monooxygenase [Steroidobacteraceae bacterium]
MDRVIMIARIRVLPGAQSRFEGIFATRRARAAAHEPGTLKYDLYAEAGDPLVYTVIEVFAGEQGLRAHLEASTDHEDLMACFDGKPEVHTLHPVLATE